MPFGSSCSAACCKAVLRTWEPKRRKHRVMAIAPERRMTHPVPSRRARRRGNRCSCGSRTVRLVAGRHALHGVRDRQSSKSSRLRACESGCARENRTRAASVQQDPCVIAGKGTARGVCAMKPGASPTIRRRGVAAPNGATGHNGTSGTADAPLPETRPAVGSAACRIEFGHSFGLPVLRARGPCASRERSNSRTRVRQVKGL
jgi:hypothetical protein